MTVHVRARSYDGRVAKAATQFACTDCGYSAGRWFGKCPSCGAFGTLVEETPPEPANGRAAKIRSRIDTLANLTRRTAVRTHS